MQKYFDSVLSRTGKAVPGASVRVTDTQGNSVSIFTDNGITPQDNPITTDQNGYFAFYAADGRYTLSISGLGITTRTITDVLLEDPAEGTLDGGLAASAKATIQKRRGTAAAWTSANPILAMGEEGYETDTKKLKIGDGVTAWSSLGYRDDFIQSGTGAVARTAQDKARERVSVKDFGAVGDGVADDTTKVQAAATYAASVGAALYVPAGIYVISSTVTIPAAVRVYGDGHAKTIFRPTITDGSACLQFAGNVTFHRLENFSVASATVGSNFLTGAANAQPCIGIALGTASAYCTRWHVSGVRVYGCATGWYVRGYIGTADNMWAEYCELGLQGIEINSCDLNLRFENCRKSYAIDNAAGLLLRQLLDEGGNSSGVVAATIDNSNGVHILAPYWEYGSSTPRPQPYLKIGGTTMCRGVRISAMNLVDYVQAGVAGIEADLCEGLYIEGRCSIGQYKRSIKTTSNTKDLRLEVTNSALLWPQDDSVQLGAAYNYFANSNFDLWFRGNWGIALDANAVSTQETSIVRKGKNAVRITATAGVSSNRKVFWLTGAPCTAMRGKTMRVYAWVWVPEIAAFPATGRTKLPGVLISSYNGTVSVAGTTVNNRATAGTWNLMYTDVAVQTDATRITLDIYVNNSGVAADGTEYIVLDSLYVAESTTPVSRVLNGTLTDHSSVNCTAAGGKMLAVGSAAPTDAGQTFEVGDVVWRDAPSAAASPGWVCTTAGAGGTAIFKAMANLAA